jgi:DNA polymerase III subunit delta'
VSLRVVGHDEQRRRLSRAWKAGRLAHAYIFAGPAGVGKQTFARELAKTLLCFHPNVDALQSCGDCGSCKSFDAETHPDFNAFAPREDENQFAVEIVREEIIPKLAFKPALSNRRATLLDDADKLNDASGNALLKTLEEPPPGSHLLLVTNKFEGVLPTIRSRCQTIRFFPLTNAETVEVLLGEGMAENEVHAQSLALTAGGSLESVDELNDDEWRVFRPRVLERFSSPTFDLVQFGKDVNKFCENAGKESAPKRRRASLVIRTVLVLLNEALRIKSMGGTSMDEAASVAAEAMSEDALLDAIDRTIEADMEVKRFLHLPTVVDCWIDDVAQIAAGRSFACDHALTKCGRKL